MKTLLIPIKQIKDYSIIDDNISDKLVKIAIIDAQTQLLEPLIGTQLYDKLISDATNGVLTADYQYLLVDKIWDFLNEATQYKLCLSLIYRMTNSTIAKDSNDNSSAISIEELNAIRQERENAMRYFADKVMKYLINNTAKFPEYTTVDVEGLASASNYGARNFYVDDEGDMTIDQWRANN